MGLPEILAVAMLGSLVLYTLLGGADFGGGVWDLLAFGPRAREQRALIDRAIAPVWEANHVWLILIVVILFSAFPVAFSAASIGLHIPLSLMLIGIVFRGSAFVFRKYDVKQAGVQRGWGRVFAVSSLLSPVFLGVCLGAVTSGRMRLEFGPDSGFVEHFVSPWLDRFPLSVGVFALCLFAFIAAVYLSVEAPDAALQADFRARALASGILSLVLAAVTAWAAATPGMEHFRQRLLGSFWSSPLLIGAGLSGVTSLCALYAKRYRLARASAVVFVSAVVCGWALAQYPYLIRPELTIQGAAAPSVTLKLLLIALCFGAVILLPSLYWLLRVFKGRPALAPPEDETHS